MIVLAGAIGTLGAWLVATALGLIGSPPLVRAASLIALALVGVVTVGGLSQFRRLARPVTELVQAAGKIEAGDYTARVAERGPREVRSVARAFNAMSARLQATDTQRRTFLADIAHELRTPLSVIRGQAEGIADGLYSADAAHLSPIIAATHTLELLVEDLRTLALSEAGSLTLAREPVELPVLINETAESFRGTALTAGVTLATQVGDDVPVLSIDPARIRAVLGNLIANAIRHTPDGGSIRVTAARSGNLVAVSVLDTGEGIAPDLLPRVFERFVKGPGSKGSGLGLAIARDLVRAHGGTIQADSDGKTGTAVRFTLPISAPAG